MPGYGIEGGKGLSSTEIYSHAPNPKLKFERSAGHLLLRWSRANAKTILSRTIAFDLPAYKTDLDGRVFTVCIGAGTCKEFCFARFGNNFQFEQKKLNMEENLRASMEPDFIDVTVHDLEILARTPIEWRDADKKLLGMGKPRSFRVHASGDFYNQAYLNKWFAIIRRLPHLKFYCYTKSFRLDWTKKPKNFLMIQSGGSLWDDDIDFKKHHALLFRDDAHFASVNAKRKKLGLIQYTYGSEDDVPARKVVPTHIGLVAGVVKGGAAKGKLAVGSKRDLYSEGEWPEFWKGRETKNPLVATGDKCGNCNHPFSFHYGGQHGGKCRQHGCACQMFVAATRRNPKEPLSPVFVTQTGVKHYSMTSWSSKRTIFLCEQWSRSSKIDHKKNYDGKRMVTKECDDCARLHEREVLRQYPNIRPIPEGSLITIVPPLCKCGHNKAIATGGFGLREEGKMVMAECSRCGKSFDGRYARVIKIEQGPSAAERAIMLAQFNVDRVKRHGDMHEDEPCAVCKHPFKMHHDGECGRPTTADRPGSICMYGDHEFRHGKWEGPPRWLKEIRPELFPDDEASENPPIRVEEAVGEDSPDADEVD